MRRAVTVIFNQFKLRREIRPREENGAMSPKRHQIATEAPPPPFVIQPNGVYTAEQVQRLLGLKPSSLRTAKREQGLVACRRGPRDLYLGSDLLAWLRGGRRSANGRDAVEGLPSPDTKEG
jgi:hypothetical protein